tara:strand:+ start:25 stop:1260 length:1236 start_codon:yes stop_codon:yes gene_type:complete
MGSIKKALKPITKVVDDIIPNEIKPALPYIAATFGAPYLSPLVGKGLGALATKMGAGKGLTAFLSSAPLAKGLAGSFANIGTQALLGKKINPVSAGISGLLAGGGELLSGLDAPLAKEVGGYLSPNKIGGMTLGEVSTAASIPLTAGTVEAAGDAARKANEEYERYLEEQKAAGNEDIQTRVDYITRYMSLAGFDQNTIDEKLNELGYAANGGLMGTRVGYKIGGSTMQNILARLFNVEVPAERLEEMRQNRADFLFNENVDAEDYPSQDYLNKVRDAAEKQATKELNEYMKKIGMDPFNPPEGSMEDEMIDQIMEPRKEGRVKEAMGGRIYKADGGIMNLKMGGMPAEMDLRGGGFVPIGAKEKADDVPARLSKNEFVMTADAVRAAGGGSVNKGAKRMYDLMNKLEARV